MDKWAAWGRIHVDADHDSRFTVGGLRNTDDAVRLTFLVLLFCFSVSVIASSLHAQTTSQKRPTLEEILGDDETQSERSGRLSATSVQNPFLHVDSLAVKVGIFLGLAGIIYCISVIGFNNALEKEISPLPAFFRFNTFFLLSILVLAFLCFSEYTRRKDILVVGLVDHFKHVNWLLWGLISALLIVLLAVSRRGQSDGEYESQDDGLSRQT